MELTMPRAEKGGEWASLSSSHGRPLGGMHGASRVDRPEPAELPEAGAIDWIQVIRGVLLFGIFAVVVYLECWGIKMLVNFISSVL
jgi:hypothetical protein